jgi:serralysin
MVGGQGNDTYLVDDAGDVVLEASSGGTDYVSVSNITSYTLGAEVEHLFYTNATGGTLTGNSGANSITGAGGNDTIDGRSGNDTLIGAAGNDYYIVDSTLDVVSDNGGTVDSVLANVNVYTLGAASGADWLIWGAGASEGTGNSLANTLVASSGNDTLNGGSGIDSLVGGVGDDYYIVDSTADRVEEGSGAGVDSVLANVNNATLGSNAEWLIYGSAASIQGGTGNSLGNTLVGNSVANTLNGGAGADSMVGGQGNDTYYVDDAGDVLVEGELKPSGWS